MEYVELQVTSNFSFLQGASHPEELVGCAAALGYNSIAITDRNSLAGIVRAHMAARDRGIRIIVGCRLDLIDGPSLLAYPTTMAAYSRLSQLLTIGNYRAGKGQCHLMKRDVYEHGEGLKFIIVSPDIPTLNLECKRDFEKHIAEYQAVFRKDLYLSITKDKFEADSKIDWLLQLGASFSIPIVATNNVHYHNIERQEIQAILTCIREESTIKDAGIKLQMYAERYLKRQEEIQFLFKEHPDAIIRTAEIASACQFSLDDLVHVYKEEITNNSESKYHELTQAVWNGAKEIFGVDLPKTVENSIKYELRLLNEMKYVDFFMKVYDIVNFARSRKIFYQGRGSAANSTVCFCLGITSINPTWFDLLPERFISSEIRVPINIDIDFEHERREEIIQYIYNKYGREHAAIIATVNQFQRKTAIQCVGKAMCLDDNIIKLISSYVEQFTTGPFEDKQLRALGLDPEDLLLQRVLSLSIQITGFPRQIRQHSGGVIITNRKLTELCPVLRASAKDRTNIEWNKDDIAALGFTRINILSLGVLTSIRKAFDLLEQHYGRNYSLNNIPLDDYEVYRMIGHGDTIGLFQIDSQAQHSLLTLFKPSNYYDLVIALAILRPGIIQGNMVLPYLRRRNGEEKIEYPSEELKEILGRTLGIPLFQEQMMRVVIIAAGFTVGEANQMRQRVTSDKFIETANWWTEKLVTGMMNNGYCEEYALQIAKQLVAFGSYSFSEHHAAGYAFLTYIAAWIKCYYPDVFSVSLLNSMSVDDGQSIKLILDTEKSGVKVNPIDINYSFWDNTLEHDEGQYQSLRLGFRQIRGIRYNDVKLLIAGRKNGGYKRIQALRNIGITVFTIKLLASENAFQSIGLNRLKALNEVSMLKSMEAGLFENQQFDEVQGTTTILPMTMRKDSNWMKHDDDKTISPLIKKHPVSLIREKLDLLNILSVRQLEKVSDNQIVKMAGLIIDLPLLDSEGELYVTKMEDETGFSMLLMNRVLFNKQRKTILKSRLLMITGKVARKHGIIHINVNELHDLTKLFGHLLK
ncbi:error-prone DNA polymerase [Chitinophaga filiformis]|uniref:DNA-directed DNA polymerase n=1 Tax=Chitinophaga filiformis TaxID=104663 RepID=A0A1G7RY32_CHIFI|nr:error-prone DNA polymerase [Chitinophaga filiformis]SDG15662.1 error-prone DNA polymerase [Chitinophaga filiformis]